MSDLILYSYFRSSTSYRVRIALHWKELPFEYRPVHLVNAGGEQYTDQYKTLNPASEVPTLVHGENTIAQSMAILEYLEEVFPAPQLLPGSIGHKDGPSTHRVAYQRARIRQFCENINCTHPLQNLKILKYLETELKQPEAAREAWLNRWLSKGLQVAETLAAQTSGKYCFGDEVTLADVFLIPQLFSAHRFKVDAEPYPTLRKIADNCSKLPAFQKAHPFVQPDTPAELRLS